jgi:hypothetical protein
MPPDFADFLDELGSYVEQRITHLPPPLAEMLSRPDTILPIQELLQILDHPENAAPHLSNPAELKSDTPAGTLP